MSTSITEGYGPLLLPFAHDLLPSVFKVEIRKFKLKKLCAAKPYI